MSRNDLLLSCLRPEASTSSAHQKEPKLMAELRPSDFPFADAKFLEFIFFWHSTTLFPRQNDKILNRFPFQENVDGRRTKIVCFQSPKSKWEHWTVMEWFLEVGGSQKFSHFIFLKIEKIHSQVPGKYRRSLLLFVRVATDGSIIRCFCLHYTRNKIEKFQKSGTDFDGRRSGPECGARLDIFLKKKVNCFEIVGLRLNKNITIFSFVFTLGLQEAQ